jgi:hypothetical protein
MKSLLKTCLLALCVATGCAATGCCAGVAAAAADKGDCTSADIEQAQSKVTSGTISGAVTGSISGATIYVERSSAGGQQASIIEFSGTPTITDPSGSTAELSFGIELTSAPSATTYTSSNTSTVSGGVTLDVGGQEFQAASAASGGATEGTWSLDLSSASQTCGISDVEASVSYYSIHGTLTATLAGTNAADGGPETVNLSMSF